MQFHRAVALAAMILGLDIASGAQAFETTSIGGSNADGSAKFQDPDELGAALSPSTGTSSPFGNFNFSVGSGADRDNTATTNWLNGPGLGFSGSSSQSTSAEPPSPFNTPILRDRN